MLEVMAFGTPVIAPAVFGVPEVIEDGINGLLFDPTSVASAADVLRRFLRIPREQRLELGEAGRQTVEANRASPTMPATTARCSRRWPTGRSRPRRCADRA